MELELPRPAVRPAPIPEAEQTARRLSLRRAPLLLGGGLLLLVLLAALIGPRVTAYAPQTVSAGLPVMPPSAEHWFGTDALGRDLFSRVVSGLGMTLWIGLAAATLTCTAGVVLGLLAGFFRGWVDTVASRCLEVLLSLPGLLLALVLIARMGPSVGTTILALGLTGIPTFFRMTRAETISLSGQPFIEASRALGQSGLGIIFRHVLPNLLGSTLVLCAMRVGTYMLMASGLSFIGLGVQPPLTELGALLAAGREYAATAWWLMIFPGLAILLTVMGFNLFGEGLRDRLDR